MASSRPPPPTSSPSSLPPNSPPFSPPASILIVGSGLFGLTLAWSLARRDTFSQCSITVVDRADPSSPDVFPSPDAASVDTSRIIRADYADAAYAALCMEAQVHWRRQDKPTHLGAQGRYTETGLVVVAEQAPAPQREVVDKLEMTGMDYARSSYDNVLSLAARHPEHIRSVRELPSPEAIRDRVGTGGSSGTWGYVNEGSGWANAGASTAWLFDRVKSTGRVSFVAGTVTSLEHDKTTVTGANLADGRTLTADLVVVAAGAWTGGLVDLSGQATATGQVLGYIDLTEAEQEQLGRMPVLLNLTTGLFIIPPTNRVLKIARHAYGYLNPVTGSSPLPSSPTAPAPQVVSQPLTHITVPSLSIPKEGADDLRRAVCEMVPLPGLAERPFTKTRLCWYSDTPTGDFLIDYHPQWKGLFVATGDSGHAFKFLPVIGDKIADCIMGNCPAEFKAKWAWKPAAPVVITEDGSRGGKPGLILADELAATQTH